jgi:hypothetical protein
LYGWPLAAFVVSALAMFAAIVSIRCRCAESPLAAIDNERNIGRWAEGDGAAGSNPTGLGID